METGKAHERACSGAMLTHAPQGVQFSFAIQVFKEYLGVLFISSDERESQLLVWNWHTGIREMVRTRVAVMSVCKLSIADFTSAIFYPRHCKGKR